MLSFAGNSVRGNLIPSYYWMSANLTRLIAMAFLKEILTYGEKVTVKYTGRILAWEAMYVPRGVEGETESHQKVQLALVSGRHRQG